jgi:ArsR family transcriptional regulator
VGKSHYPGTCLDNTQYLGLNCILRYAYNLTAVYMHGTTKLFKALSDETRLRTLNLLLERECSVCEVMQAMKISQTRASRVLTALHSPGILKVRPDGLWALYSIDEEAIEKFYRCLLELIRGVLQGDELAELYRERLKSAVWERSIYRACETSGLLIVGKCMSTPS